MRASEGLVPPSAPRRPKTRVIHGARHDDDYGWLRQYTDPAVVAYLQAENAYVEAALHHTESLQRTLYEEILGHIQESDVGPPVRVDHYVYYWRRSEGSQYPIFCRRRAAEEPSTEQVILDQNELASGHDYHALGGGHFSDDHAMLAFSEDTTGEESFTIRFRDLRTNHYLSDQLTGTYYTYKWSLDTRSLFYVAHNDAMRPYRLYQHVLGTEQQADTLLFEEPDEQFHLSIARTRSKRYLLLHLESSTTTEIRYAEDEWIPEFRTFAARRQGIEYELNHQEGRFLILTNEDAPNFAVFETRIDEVSRSSWTELVAHRDDVKIESIDAFIAHLVLTERHEGLVRLRVQGYDGGLDRYVEMPEPAGKILPGENQMYETDTYQFRYTSLVTPMSWFEHSIESGETSLVKQQDVPGYNPTKYVTDRLWVTASDGARVPVSLVYRVDAERPMNCWITGYGAYGESLDPEFSAVRISILDRGYCYAIAHVRGGGELGEAWHASGRRLEKSRSIDDFVDCARHLIDAGYATAGSLVVHGASAGGLLVGAVLNRAADLVGAALAERPFVDILTSMLDPDHPLTAYEWDEWGNPLESKECFDYIESYSPYENVSAREYPPMLVTAGINDSRVHFSEPAKWVARLRERKTDSNALLLKTYMDAGHFGPTGRYEWIREQAMIQAFAFEALEMKGALAEIDQVKSGVPPPSSQ